jgi:hypothetical protein
VVLTVACGRVDLGVVDMLDLLRMWCFLAFSSLGAQGNDRSLDGAHDCTVHGVEVACKLVLKLEFNVVSCDFLARENGSADEPLDCRFRVIFCKAMSVLPLAPSRLQTFNRANWRWCDLGWITIAIVDPAEVSWEMR